MTLADSNTPCSIGLGTNLPSTFSGITFGSTDSQRGGVLTYIGTNTVSSCNRQIAVLGSSGGANNFSILNNSPNNSSLHFSTIGPVAFSAPAMSNCAITLGGSAVAANTFDPLITNAPNGNASVTVNGSAWTLTAAETYAGNTTVSGGTLALGASGSIAKSPVISITAGATFDVSAAGITLTGSSPQQTLAAGSTSGTATVNAPGHTVTLNTSALLTFQAAGGVSSLVGKISVSGALANLTLNNNTVTVNVAGSALAAGSYRLLDCTGTLTGTAGTTPTITGTALSSGYTATVSTTTGSAGHVDLIVKATPAFSGLSSKSIAYGTTNMTLSGTVSATGGSTTVYPANGETINALINGHAVGGTVTNSTGGFWINYNDASLATDGVGSSPYTATYSYAGNSTQLNAAANDTSTTLTVNKAGSAAGVVSSSNPSVYGQTGVTFAATVTDGSAGSIGTPTGTVQFQTNGVNFGGTVALSGGGATSGALPATLNPGNISVTVTYGGDASFNTSTSGVLTQAVNHAGTAVAIASSSNPCGFKDGIFFTATLPADATGNVVFASPGNSFSTNMVGGASTSSLTITNLPRGTNVITVAYSGDLNYLASTNTLNQVVTNHPPVAGGMTVSYTAGLTLKVALSQMATNWSDVDGDPVSLTSINFTTTNGVNLQSIDLATNLAGSYLITNTAFLGYFNSGAVNDQFTYGISDGQGGTNMGIVNLVVSTSAVTGQATGIIAPGGGPVTVSFAGIPGYGYNVQRSTNLLVWVTLWTTNAPSGGLFNYTDSFGDLGGIPPGSAYYRLTWVP
jgi:hypothetical protein